MKTAIQTKVSAFMGGTLNWAVFVIGTPPQTVVTMVGDDSAKEVRVETDDGGRLGFVLNLNAFPGTAWKLELFRAGQTTASYAREGLTDSLGRGHDEGQLFF